MYTSYLSSGDSSQIMDFTANPIWTCQNSVVYSDDVIKHGKVISISSGRIYSTFYHVMISLCLPDVNHCEMGSEVQVLWGDNIHTQKLIRATMSRCPFLDLPRNKDIEVNCI